MRGSAHAPLTPPCLSVHLTCTCVFQSAKSLVMNGHEDKNGDNSRVCVFVCVRVAAHIHNRACANVRRACFMHLICMCQPQPSMCGGESLLNGNSDNPVALKKKKKKGGTN